ncbi:hypothetical protein [Stenotrophomonas sp.]|uniref:hypothetical protein n=1 Tax=Stenotrophomonas sp. TaxID=69392 RepID=UPI0028A124E8|nr:hypothetical protein [Stenotrophomonas sp.]
MKRNSAPSMLLAAMATVILTLAPATFESASAQLGHRGGGGARASAHANVNRAAQRPMNRPAGGAVNRNVDHNRSIDHNRDVNRNVNRNVNRDVHVDVDHHYDHDHWNDWDDHPFATAAAVTAGVAVTRAVIGSIVYSLPPSCVTTVVNGVAYQQCGSDWYEPRYAGTSVQYVVINAPR